jgi:hypothetical protein
MPKYFPKSTGKMDADLGTAWLARAFFAYPTVRDVMTRQEYQEVAAECARMAEQTQDPTTKMVSAGLAQAWLELAQIAAERGKLDGEAPELAPTESKSEQLLPVLSTQS